MRGLISFCSRPGASDIQSIQRGNLSPQGFRILFFFRCHNLFFSSIWSADFYASRLSRIINLSLLLFSVLVAASLPSSAADFADSSAPLPYSSCSFFFSSLRLTDSSHDQTYSLPWIGREDWQEYQPRKINEQDILFVLSSVVLPARELIQGLEQIIPLTFKDIFQCRQPIRAGPRR